MSFGLNKIKLGANTSLDGTIIPIHLAVHQQGYVIPEAYAHDEVPVASPVYLDSSGKVQILGYAAKEFSTLPGDVELIGVVKATVLKEDTLFAVMDMGVVELSAMEIKYPEALLTALKSNLKISFRK